MKKTLILVRDKRKYFWQYACDLKNIEICEVYKREISCNLLNKIRKKKKNCYLYWGILGDWVKRLNLYEKIIFLDSSYTQQVDKVLRRFEGQIYFFYWNKMNLDYDLAKKQTNLICDKIKVYSYSRFDCELHDLPYNTTMYSPSYNASIHDSPNKEGNYDVVFGGRLFEDRMMQLDKMLDCLNKMGISYYMDVCLDSKQKESEYVPRNFAIKESVLKYEDYISLVKSAKAILNLDKYEGMGCSLRAMEAIFNKKKYITDNKDVRNEVFYDPQNVFILGEDDIKNLPIFLEEPYKEYDKSVLEYYELEQWAERFC